MSEIPNEIKITHIHKGKNDESSFIEFIKIDKRFGVEVTEAFKTSTTQ